MKTRCNNQNSTDYTRYGGRGIKITLRWLGPNGFSNFLKDMKERPLNKTLERLNCNGNYSPKNCVWATFHEQALNRNPRITCINGHKLIPSNIFKKSNGSRGCLICKRLAWRKWKDKQ